MRKMVIVNLILYSIILINITICNKIKTSSPPNIIIYSESLCPDCYNFYTKQLKKLISNPDIEKLINSIESISFGNASELPDSIPGNRIFNCQHGKLECHGNKLQNCYADRLKSKSDNAINLKLENLTVCFMENTRKAETGLDSIILKCLKDEPELANNIIECANSTEGDELLHIAAEKTGKHDYVPYYIINGEHDEDTQNEIDTDIVKFLCKYNDLVDKVEGCKSNNFLKVEKTSYLFNINEDYKCYNDNENKNTLDYLK